MSNSEESSSAATRSRPIDTSRPSTTVEHDPDSSSSIAALEQRSPGIAVTVELDVANFIPHLNFDDQTKYDYLANHWKPESTYKFPRVARKVKGKTVTSHFNRNGFKHLSGLPIVPLKMELSSNIAEYLHQKKEVVAALKHL